MDTNTLARIENEYSKLTENINKKKTLTDNHYKLLIKQYADVLAQRINLARKEK